MKGLISILLFCASMSFAQEPDDSKVTARPQLSELLEQVICKSEIEALLASSGSKNTWRKVFQSGERRLWRSPTLQWAKWIELQSDLKKGVASLTVVRPESFEVHSFERNKCEAKVKKIVTKPVDHFLKAGEKVDYLTDDALFNKIRDGKPGFVYLWSPGMVYSVQAMESYRLVAKKLKMRMIEVMAPNVTFSHAAQVAHHYKVTLAPILKNDAMELTFRGAQIHYPSIVAFNRGVLSFEPEVGVFPPTELESTLKRKLELLAVMR